MAGPCYSTAIRVRCQPELVELVGLGANKRGSKPSEYVRQAILAVLRLDGLELGQIGASEAQTNPEPSQSQPGAI
jgi:hypothetical protein